MSIKRRDMLGLLGSAAIMGGLAGAGAPVRAAEHMGALECIHTRRSTRRYLDKPVPDELVTELLQAAMTAPSAHNEQPWRFLVVKNREMLEKVAAANRNAAMAAKAGLGILVCGDPELAKTKDMTPLDCSNASMSILLAAHALGLGGVWTASYPEAERMANYRSIFGIPESIIPFSFICLGWPEQPGGKREDRFKKDRVKYDRW